MILVSRSSSIIPQTLWNTEVTLCFHSGAHHDSMREGYFSLSLESITDLFCFWLPLAAISMPRLTSNLLRDSRGRYTGNRASFSQIAHPTCLEHSPMLQALLHLNLYQIPCQPTSVLGEPNADSCSLISQKNSRPAYLSRYCLASLHRLHQQRHVRKINSHWPPYQHNYLCLLGQICHLC